jgi:hypothetical protein
MMLWIYQYVLQIADNRLSEDTAPQTPTLKKKKSHPLIFDLLMSTIYVYSTGNKIRSTSLSNLKFSYTTEAYFLAWNVKHTKLHMLSI